MHISTPDPSAESSNGKGKQKEENEDASATADDFAAPLRATPFLSAPGDPGIQSTIDWNRAPRSSQASDEAVEDRLRVLRDVDQRIWALVAELTRVQSAWASSDQTTAQSEGAPLDGQEDR